MQAAAILGLGCSPKDLKPFQTDTNVEWRLGMPASGDDCDAILLFGGDGTVHRHLGQLVKLRLPVLVVPTGSGNDFATSLGLGRIRDSLSAWDTFCATAANVRQVDLGIIAPGESAPEPFSAGAQSRSAPHTQYFCCVAGVGFDGEVARRANGLPRWLRGHGGYMLSAAPAIFTFAPLPMKISAPSENSSDWNIRSDQPTLLAAFANTPLYGGGMKVAPQAKVDDGLLDVCIVGSVGRLKLFAMFPTVYAGRHLRIKEVQYFHAPRVRVETETPIDVYADGEYVCRTPVEVSLERGALRVIAPKA